MMDKTIEILCYIDELYRDGENKQALLNIDIENPELYGMWKTSFEDYSFADVKSAIRRYWTYKNDRTAPKVAHLLAYLEEDHKDEQKQQEAQKQPETTLLPTAETLMAKDDEAGNLHHFLWDYRQAFRLCTEDWLAEVIPAEEYAYAMSHWPRNIKLALENGLIDRMDEALRIVSMKNRGKEIAFESKNDLLSRKGKLYGVSMPQTDSKFKTPQVNVLSAHFRGAM